ncbi:hypothetical protein TUM19329_04040 [Legionella antarctica]|uniref:Uncharacterized protein n=1 Tax=Legionella antarctica TaxID=2708020 RepID=A0A6F8T1E0_9GAMM|nr:hypothetical protein TUM19329_04040 [Legionella antarctica]
MAGTVFPGEGRYKGPFWPHEDKNKKVKEARKTQQTDFIKISQGLKFNYMKFNLEKAILSCINTAKNCPAIEINFMA